MSTDAVTSMLSDTQPGSLLHPGLDHPTQVLSGASLHPGQFISESKFIIINLFLNLRARICAFV